MQEIGSYDVSANSFRIPETPVPEGENSLKMTMSHWTGGSLDLDLEVSYDGGANWMYGGGAKGAISAEPGIEFHFTYQIPPTHVRGYFSSDQDVSSTLKFLAGK
jgi:hypothetical protein